VAGHLHNGRPHLAYLTGEESRLSVSLDCGAESRGQRDVPARNNSGRGAGCCHLAPTAGTPLCGGPSGWGLLCRAGPGAKSSQKTHRPACKTQADHSKGRGERCQGSRPPPCPAALRWQLAPQSRRRQRGRLFYYNIYTLFNSKRPRRNNSLPI